MGDLRSHKAKEFAIKLTFSDQNGDFFFFFKYVKVDNLHCVLSHCVIEFELLKIAIVVVNLELVTLQFMFC